MTCPSSAPISFSQVKAEFLGTNSLSVYVRGGSYVANSAPNSAVSTTSAGLALSQFYSTTRSAGSHSSSLNASTRSGNGTDGIAPPSVVGATSNTSTVTPSGGVGPFTYSWAYVSGDSMTINSSTSASTTFSSTGLAGDPVLTKVGVFRVTVTDTGNSNYQTTNDVTVTLTFTYAP